jgi:uncharacterized membrane protein YcaP (DUF421 family)
MVGEVHLVPVLDDDARVEAGMDAKLWTDMMGLGVPIAEKVLRPIIVYAFLVVGFRLAGKRELAQLNPFDLVVLLTISNTVQNAIIGDDNSVTGGILGACTLLVINYLVVRFLYRHEALEHLLEGDPDVLIAKGRLLAHNLEREAITRAQLEVAAHKQGFASLADIDRAVLEPGGSISFIGKRPQPEEARHQQLLKRLDGLEQHLARLVSERTGHKATGEV